MAFSGNGKPEVCLLAASECALNGSFVRLGHLLVLEEMSEGTTQQLIASLNIAGVCVLSEYYRPVRSSVQNVSALITFSQKQTKTNKQKTHRDSMTSPASTISTPLFIAVN